MKTYRKVTFVYILYYKGYAFCENTIQHFLKAPNLKYLRGNNASVLNSYLVLTQLSVALFAAGLRQALDIC